MTDVILAVPVLAMAQPAQGSTSALVQILPFALMLGVFYVLVLMPMRKRQKKVQDFQGALKEGDRVITTGGMYGQVTRIAKDEKDPKYGVVQLQIADKVRIEVARASIGGYQGQEPVVKQDSGGL